jgi:hypothetical protein
MKLYGVFYICYTQGRDQQFNAFADPGQSGESVRLCLPLRALRVCAHAENVFNGNEMNVTHKGEGRARIQMLVRWALVSTKICCHASTVFNYDNLLLKK